MRAVVFAGLLSLTAVTPAQATPAPARPARATPAPAWPVAELRQLLQGVSQAAALPPEQVNTALLRLAQRAYRGAGSEAPLPAQAKRLLRARLPGHPDVPQAQWILALSRQLYADLAARATTLGRLEPDRGRRAELLQAGQQLKQAAAQLGGQLQWMIPGLELSVPPLPVVDGPRLKPRSRRGELVLAEPGAVRVGRVVRARFVDHAIPPGTRRTGAGAHAQLYGAIKQLNQQNKMLARLSKRHAREAGQLQLIVPAALPARYLNEVLRAAGPAGIRRVHLLLMNPRGRLRQLSVGLGGKRRHAVEVSCPDQTPMDRCAQRLLRAAPGPLRYRVPAL